MDLQQAAAKAELALSEAQKLVDLGLVSPDPNSGGYDDWRVAQFAVAKRAMELGVEQAKLERLLSYFAKEAAACAELTALAERQSAEIDKQLEELRAARSQTQNLEGAA